MLYNLNNLEMFMAYLALLKGTLVFFWSKKINRRREEEKEVLFFA